MQNRVREKAKEYAFRRLFEPLQIKRIKLRNRIVYPAFVTSCASPDGFVTQGLIIFHEAIAEHTGLSIVELSLIRPKGGVSRRQVHIYDDKYIPGLAKLAQAIKAKGAAAIAQLCDLGARAGSLGAIADPVAPSKITLGPVEARELSVGEIEMLVAAFAEAAVRAYEAGFDGVEIHACHLYLISEFLSPYCNKRTDRYGGSVENRARFLLEIIEATKKRVPDDFLLLCRVDVFEPFEEGATVEEIIRRAQLLEQAGVDILNLSRVCQKVTVKQHGKSYDWFTTACPPNWPEGHEIKYAVRVKEAVKIPTIAVGKIFSPQLAENVLELNQADMIAMARSLIADPELPRKVAEGREDEILRCKEDFRCVRCLSEGKPIACAVNKSLPPKNTDVLA